MSYNVFRRIKALFPDPPLLVATVTAIDGDVATCQLPDGGVIRARGAASVSQKVFVRDSVIEGVAPDLPILLIDV